MKGFENQNTARSHYEIAAGEPLRRAEERWSSNKRGPQGKKEEKPYLLGDNIPNPFEGTTLIPYRVPAGAEARLIVYDTHGKTVLSLPLKSGKKQVSVNCSTWPAGIYLYTLHVNGTQVASNKMTLLK